MKIEVFDPQKLATHKLLDLMPSWEDGDPRFLALCDSVRDEGVIEPLKVYIPAQPRSDGKVAVVVDGRHRNRAARRMQLPGIPAAVVSEAEAASIILSTLVHRRHFRAGRWNHGPAGIDRHDHQPERRDLGDHQRHGAR